jgi:hypothetical protein
VAYGVPKLKKDSDQLPGKKRSNVMPFTRGQSGNPGGRPKKGKSLTEALEKAMKRKSSNGKRNYDAMADTLVKLAIEDKNITAIKYIMDRVDGRPKETIVMTDGAIDVKLKEILNGGGTHGQ